MKYQLTSLQAFNAMRLFLEKYYKKTYSDDIGSMLGDLQFFQPGVTADPAAGHNWEKCIKQVHSDDTEILTQLKAFKAMRLFLEKYYEETASVDIAYILKEAQFIENERNGSPIWKSWLECTAEIMRKKEQVSKLDRLL